jgi:predicted glycosyltransferase involved in capsule biosynthesis
MNESIEFLLLQKQVENIDLQVKHFVAHLESEQQVYGGHQRLIDANKLIMEMHQKLIDKHDLLLLNNGKGLVFKVDRLEQRNSNNRSILSLWISLIATAAAIISIIVR